MPLEVRKRMYGFYLRWGSSAFGLGKNVVFSNRGQIRNEVWLATGLHHVLRTGPAAIAELANNSGPNPEEIYYYDQDDPSTNLLELDERRWRSFEQDEASALSHATGAEGTEQIDSYPLLSTSSPSHDLVMLNDCESDSVSTGMFVEFPETGLEALATTSNGNLLRCIPTNNWTWPS
ncbi:hypothetical protein ANO11243_061890 [Dothideomycetidae sp. 11243]|nr:hypothetical protein ANO11243_061890 [fungal sp. No.11243]